MCEYLTCLCPQGRDDFNGEPAPIRREHPNQRRSAAHPPWPPLLILRPFFFCYTLLMSHGKIHSHNKVLPYKSFPSRITWSKLEPSTSCSRRSLKERAWHIVSKTKAESLLLIGGYWLWKLNHILSISPFCPDVFCWLLSATLFSKRVKLRALVKDSAGIGSLLIKHPTTTGKSVSTNQWECLIPSNSQTWTKRPPTHWYMDTNI